jgi:hypothetical protein
MPRHKPAQHQWQFDWDADPKRTKRGQQLLMLRKARLGCLKLRAMLREIDDRIPNHQELRPETFALSMADLIDELELSRSEGYELCDRLRALGVLAWDDLPNGRREFWICWGTLSEFAHPDPAQRPEVPTLREFRQQRRSEKLGQHQEPPIPQVRNGSDSSPEELESSLAEDRSSPEEDHSSGEESLNRNIATLSQPSPSSTGTPAAGGGGGGEIDGPEAGKREALNLVRRAGVGRFVQAVDTATANGMTLAQVAAVARHALTPENREPCPRWSGAIVHDRLTMPGAAMLSPEDGWWGDNPDWTAAQRQRSAQAPTSSAPTPGELEARYGDALDALDDGELAKLRSELTMRDAAEFDRAIAAGDDPRERTIRVALLQRLSLWPAIAARERERAMATV